MLKKLIKYELKSTSKEFSILYLTFFLLTIINKIYITSINYFSNSIENSTLYDILERLHNVLIFAYHFLCIGIFLLTFTQILIRFYKNLTGNEGYLTFTLPVPTWMLIISKLISSVIWLICSLFSFLLSQSILFWEDGFGEFVKNFISDFIPSAHPAYIFGIILILLFLIVHFASTTAEFYFFIAVGHLSKKYRIISAIITFFLYNFLKIFLISCFFIKYLFFIVEKADQIFRSFYQNEKGLEFITYWNVNASVLIILLLIITGILSFITIKIFKNHLNLE